MQSRAEPQQHLETLQNQLKLGTSLLVAASCCRFIHRPANLINPLHTETPKKILPKGEFKDKQQELFQDITAL